MAKHGDGYLATISGKPYFRTRIQKRRPAIPIACTDKKAIDERVRVLRRIVKRLREAGQLAVLESMLRDAACAKLPQELNGVLTVVDDVCRNRVRVAPQIHPTMTFEELFTLWNNGTLHELYPDEVGKIKPKTASDYEGAYRLHVKPVMGHLPVRAVQLSHAREVLKRIKSERGGSRRRTLATVVMRTLSLAVFPCEILERSPLPREFRPKADKPRVMAMLYPKEDAMYLACTEIPLPERMLLGLLTREGMRPSELILAQVKDFDRESGIFYLDENKTDDPRSWAFKEDTAEALRRYLTHVHSNPVPEAPLLVQGNYIRTAGKRLSARAKPATLRKNARTAGLLRPQLWLNNKVRRHLTSHDMRGTFVTISLAEGRSEVWITDRTGHKSSQMVHHYRREGRQYELAKLGSLAPLHEAIPELKALGATSAAQDQDVGPEPGRRTSSGDVATTAASSEVAPTPRAGVPSEATSTRAASSEAVPTPRAVPTEVTSTQPVSTGAASCAATGLRESAPSAAIATAEQEPAGTRAARMAASEWTPEWTPASAACENSGKYIGVITNAYTSPVRLGMNVRKSNRQFSVHVSNGCIQQENGSVDFHWAPFATASALSSQ